MTTRYLSGDTETCAKQMDIEREPKKGGGGGGGRRERERGGGGRNKDRHSGNDSDRLTGKKMNTTCK